MKHYNWTGAVLFTAGMTTFGLYGFSNVPDVFALILLVAGLILLGLFFGYEMRAENPVIPDSCEYYFEEPRIYV